MMLQLNPPIPVVASGRNGLFQTGMAIGWIDYSQEHNLLWVVAYDNDGEIWIEKNPNVRLRQNITMERGSD